jgi:putative selenate reductase YgfK subunit
MSTGSCPVARTIDRLNQTIASGRLKDPRTRRMAEEINDLMQDIAWGRAGKDHLPAIHELIDQLLQRSTDDQGVDLARSIAETLEKEHEVFESHVRTHNCTSGQCIKLAPAPCQMACPAGIDIPTYVTLIGQGRDAEAIEIIRKDNPFPWVCGLVCTRPCEFMCVRGRIDKPVSIKFLKAFAAERAMSERSYRNPLQAPPKNQKVCVIGAGPGGMSAAYYLALKGYSVRVIEALPVAGGMIMVGIPRYRLPREVIDREVAMIEALGVEFCFNTRFGRDITLDRLKAEGYSAFFFAIGAHASLKLGIAGENDYPQAIDAIRFLQDVALGNHHAPGSRVLVIGGGNVAIDAARTALRLGCDEVTIVYRRTRNEMPADSEEVEQAEEEGVKFAFLTIPVEILGKNGRLNALKCVRAQLVQKPGSQRMSPVPILASEHLLAVDTIICAIGQRVDQRDLSGLKGLKWTRRDTIDANKATAETAMTGVFAAGDAVTGPATVIEAIGGGKRAAEAIDRYLSGIPQPQMPPVPVRRSRTEFLEVSASTKMILKRPHMPLLAIDRRRTTFQQVELGYTENMVREEARRCLRCDICRRCGKCVEVCRDKMGIDALQLGYLDFDHPVTTDFRLTEQRCIACGACAANCPNEAMRIADRNTERQLSLCGTVLNRQPLMTCASCGAVMGPYKYLDYIRKRVKPLSPATGDLSICDACARRQKVHVTPDNLPV